MILLIVATGLSGLAILILLAIYWDNNSGLKGIPTAHFTSPFSNLWLLSVRWRSVENHTRVDLHRRLGPVVRLGPREISVDGVDSGMQVIYGSRFYKDDWWRAAFCISDEDILFSMKSAEEHGVRRKMLANAYSKTNVLTSVLLEDSLSTTMSLLKKRIDGWAESGTAVEFKYWAKAAIIDITSAWCFGSAQCTNHLLDDAARTHLFDLVNQSWAPLLWLRDLRLVTAALRLVGIEMIPETYLNASSKLRQWAEKLTAQALSSRNPQSATSANVFELFYKNIKTADPAVSDDRAIAVISPELYDHTIASYELTSIALTYTMYELSRSPKIQQALHQELRTLATPSNQLRAQRIDNLPLLDNILTETLRVRPPGVGPWPRFVPKGGCRLANRFDIPAGTKVSSSVWTIHGNSDVFPSPWTWRPERWSDADEPQKQKMRKWFWAFGGSGARMCIAIHFATHVLKEMLVDIYSNYETSLDESFTGSMEQFDALLGFPMSNSLHIKFRRLASSD